MKECPRCFFLNPDHAEYCIKCRFHIGIIYGKSSAQTPDTHGWSSPNQGAVTPSSGEPASQAKTGGEGSTQRDAEATQTRDSVPEPARQDLSEEFEGRTFYEVGGYRLGGTPAEPPDTPPPSDFHAVLAAEKPEPKRKRAERKKKQIKGLPKPPKEPRSKTKRAPREHVSQTPAFLPSPTGDLLDNEIMPLIEERIEMETRPPAVQTPVVEEPAPLPVQPEPAEAPKPAAEHLVTDVLAQASPEPEVVEAPKPATDPLIAEVLAPPPVKPEAVEAPRPAAEHLVADVLAPPPVKPEVVEAPKPAAEPPGAEEAAPAPVKREVLEAPKPVAEAPAPPEPAAAEKPPPAKPSLPTSKVQVAEVSKVVDKPQVTDLPPVADVPPVAEPTPVAETAVPAEPVKTAPPSEPKEPATDRPPAPQKVPPMAATRPRPPIIAAETTPATKEEISPPPEPIAPKDVTSDATAVRPPVRSHPLPASSDTGTARVERPGAHSKKKVSGGRHRKSPQPPGVQLPRVAPGTGVPLEHPRDEE